MPHDLRTGPCPFCAVHVTPYRPGKDIYFKEHSVLLHVTKNCSFIFVELTEQITAHSCLKMVASELEFARRVLRDVEFCWSPDDYDRCPSCNGKEPNHRPNCQLLIALGKP